MMQVLKNEIGTALAMCVGVFAALVIAGVCFGQEPGVELHLDATPPKQVSATLIEVQSLEPNDITQWGSGVMIDEKRALTCLHVVSGPIRVRVPNSDWIKAEVVAVHFANDWALLELASELKQAQPIEIADNPPDIGSKVVAFGFGGYEKQRRLRRIEGVVVENSIVGPKPISGDSGGPIFDNRGRLCGVVSRGLESGREWWGFGLGNSIKSFCDRREVRGGHVLRVNR